MTPPEFISISIDKTEAVAGNSINISIDATDNSGIKYATVYYETPITKRSKGVTLSLVNGKYVGKIDITNADESGIWKIHSIQLYDGSSIPILDIQDRILKI